MDEQPLLPKPRRTLAIASLVVGILSLPTFGLFCVGSIISVILGLVALSRARKEPALYGGSSLAIAGIVLGAVSFLLSAGIAIAAAELSLQPIAVRGNTMSPAINDGDRIFVSRRFDSINRGDIVVFRFPPDPSKSFIKRVVGLPGERIQIDANGVLYIDGRLVGEPYVSPDSYRYPRELPETQIGPNSYFVRGDNRDVSNDSRSWGVVPRKNIYGKFLIRYFRAFLRN